MKTVGIDEAGRGPVIGPMVIAGVMTDEKDIIRIEATGAKDSKLLSPLQRERLYEVITKLDYADYNIRIIPPSEIDDALNSVNLNLNSLEALHSAMIINKLKPKRALIDLPSNNRQTYEQYIKINLNVACELVCEHKADVKYPLVSAGSILAKVTRDAEIEKIKKDIGIDFGSGYPSDPKTVAFLKKNFDNPKYSNIFRKTWDSYRRIAEGKKQKSLGEY